MSESIDNEWAVDHGLPNCYHCSCWNWYPTSRNFSKFRSWCWLSWSIDTSWSSGSLGHYSGTHVGGLNSCREDPRMATKSLDYQGCLCHLKMVDFPGNHFNLPEYEQHNMCFCPTIIHHLHPALNFIHHHKPFHCYVRSPNAVSITAARSREFIRSDPSSAVDHQTPSQWFMMMNAGQETQQSLIKGVGKKT